MFIYLHAFSTILLVCICSSATFTHSAEPTESIINSPGYFDELSAAEYETAISRVCNHLQLTSLGGRVLKNRNSRILPNPETWDVLLFPSLVRVAMEMPSKAVREAAFENPLAVPRVARVAIHWPESRTVQEVLVDLGVESPNGGVRIVRQLPDNKRPLGAMELQALDDLAADLALVMADLLKRHYEAGYHLAGPTRSVGGRQTKRDNYCTTLRKLFASKAMSADQPFCLIAVPSLVLRTGQDRESRSVLMRLERITTSHFQNPTDIRFKIDISKSDYKHWNITDIWLQNRHFSSIETLKKTIEDNDIHLRTYKFNHDMITHDSTNRYSPPGRHGKQEEKKSFKKPTLAPTFPGTIKNKFVRYGNWTFHVGVLRDTGVRFFDIRFQSRLMVAEAGLEEIVSIYHGDNPLADRTVSLASVQGIGESWSELTPGVDCPADAAFLSVQMVGDPENGPFTLHRGLCLFESDAPMHGGANRRFFGLYKAADGSEATFGYATGMHEPALLVVGIATILGNQYRFVTVFTPVGGIDMHVQPTAYVHFDLPMSECFTPALLEPAPQTTNLLFYLDLDVLVPANTVVEERAGSLPWNDPFEDVSMYRRLVRSELEEPAAKTTTVNAAVVKHTLVCSEELQKHRCIQVSFSTQTPILFTEANTEAFAWITKHLWVSRYHEDEMRGSSVYNGVDISNPVVDFKNFIADNESVVNEDVVLWANLVSIHVPSSEDYPHNFMPTSNHRITLRPVNFFDYSPERYFNGNVFTENFSSWLNGYVMKPTSAAFSKKRTTSR